MISKFHIPDEESYTRRKLFAFKSIKSYWIYTIWYKYLHILDPLIQFSFLILFILYII